MEKALLELKMVVDYRIRELAKDNPKPQQPQRIQQNGESMMLGSDMRSKLKLYAFPS